LSDSACEHCKHVELAQHIQTSTVIGIETQLRES